MLAADSTYIIFTLKIYLPTILNGTIIPAPVDIIYFGLYLKKKKRLQYIYKKINLVLNV